MERRILGCTAGVGGRPRRGRRHRRNHRRLHRDREVGPLDRALPAAPVLRWLTNHEITAVRCFETIAMKPMLRCNLREFLFLRSGATDRQAGRSKQPEWRGELMIDGALFEISAWERE